MLHDETQVFDAEEPFTFRSQANNEIESHKLAKSPLDEESPLPSREIAPWYHSREINSSPDSSKSDRRLLSPTERNDD
jgi:hypothetical protein